MRFVTVYAETQPSEGEDAEPLALDLGDGWFAIAALDGLGGEGARQMRRVSDGARHSSAWFGARIAREALGHVLGELRALAEERQREGGDGEVAWTGSLGLSLTDFLQLSLADALTQFEASTSKLVSKRLRDLPTTLALMIGRRDGEQLTAATLWAGDLHVYALSRGDGLQLLTRDEFAGTYDDAAFLTTAFTPAGAYVDRPMANHVHAGKGWSLYDRLHRSSDSLMAFAATDGVYECFKSPVGLERALLDAIRRSRDIEEMRGHLQATIEDLRQDDATLALVCFEDDWSEVQRAAADLQQKLGYSGPPSRGGAFIPAGISGFPRPSISDAAAALEHQDRSIKRMPIRPEDLVVPPPHELRVPPPPPPPAASPRGLLAAASAAVMLLLGGGLVWLWLSRPDMAWAANKLETEGQQVCGQPDNRGRLPGTQQKLGCLMRFAQPLCARLGPKFPQCAQTLEQQARQIAVVGRSVETLKAEFDGAWQPQCQQFRDLQWRRFRECLVEAARIVCQDAGRPCEAQVRPVVDAIAGTEASVEGAVEAFKHFFERDCKRADNAARDRQRACRDGHIRSVCGDLPAARQRDCVQQVWTASHAVIEPDRGRAWAERELKRRGDQECLGFWARWTSSRPPDPNCLLNRAQDVCAKMEIEQHGGCGSMLLSRVYGPLRARVPPGPTEQQR